MEKNKDKFRKELQTAPIRDNYAGSGKLTGKLALITGGDSGIGRAVAVHFAREGADVAIVYLKNDADAQQTADWVKAEGRECLLIKGDLANERFCRKAVDEATGKKRKLNILVNNAGRHDEDANFEDISKEQLLRTFQVNIYPLFYLTQEALKYMPEGGSIINTASVTAYRGSGHLIDYASTKGAIVSFTRSLAANLAEKNIRVNAIAPGPIWTPLVVDAFDAKQLQKFGKDVPLGRAGYPYEVAPAFVYLAGDDSTYVTGQVIHVNGGEVVNG